MPITPIAGFIGGGIAGAIKGYATATGTGITPPLLDAIVTYGPVPIAAALGGLEGSIMDGFAGAFGWDGLGMAGMTAGATAVTTLVGEAAGYGLGYLLGR